MRRVSGKVQIFPTGYHFIDLVLTAFFCVSHKTQMRVQMEEKLTRAGKRDMFQRNPVGQLHVRREKHP